MLSSEIIKKVKNIQIKTNHLVTGAVAGSYESSFKGQGINFEEVREYSPGDDVRNIDWNVTAKMDNAYIKVFKEERELTIMLLVDLSASGKFGSTIKTKNELAAEIAAILTCTAIKNNDKVGMIIFTNKVEKFIPPKKGNSHIWRVIKDILSFEPENTHTNISVALEYLMHVMPKKSVSFLVSDFISDGYEKLLRIANKKHDIIAVYVNDKREYILPNVGLVELIGAEDGETYIINTNNKKFMNEYSILSNKRKQNTIELFKSSGVDYIDIWTDKSCVEPIIKLFNKRGSKTR